ncbi:hypothetical protein LTR53_012397 [Teratosphaeriaceae sp. CCFEE 6253]|nr:hypothetical protein LTR53_012397 [Teratosphaeriaceae sp. CCFEE 6253]
MATRTHDGGPSSQEERDRAAAWKYVGYPGFSRFMASSNDCLALRKFSSLNVRVLLKLQNDIVDLERRLDEMDHFTKKLPGREGGCGSFRLDTGSPREAILKKIAAALEDYNHRLVDFLQIRDRPTASVEQVRNVRNWLANYPNAVESPEREFMDHDQDLMAVRTARRTYFGRWMQSLGLANLTSFLPTGSKAATRYYDRNAWKNLGGMWLLLCILGMLIGPLWASRYLSEAVVRLAVVTAFTATFSLIVVLGTTLKAANIGVWVAGYAVALKHLIEYRADSRKLLYAIDSSLWSDTGPAWARSTINYFGHHRLLRGYNRSLVRDPWLLFRLNLMNPEQ